MLERYRTRVPIRGIEIHRFMKIETKRKYCPAFVQIKRSVLIINEYVFKFLFKYLLIMITFVH